MMSSEKTHPSLSGHDETAKSLKNSTLYIDQIFRLCHYTTRPISENCSILSWAAQIEISLKKLLHILPKYMVPMDTHQKLVKQIESLNEAYQTLLKDHRDYKCQINVLQKQLDEVQLRQKLLLEQKCKLTFTKDFSTKLDSAHKQSVSRLDRIKNQKPTMKARKKSLPTILRASSNIKLGNRSSIHVLGLLSDDQKTQRLVEHLRKKY